MRLLLHTECKLGDNSSWKSFLQRLFFVIIARALVLSITYMFFFFRLSEFFFYPLLARLDIGAGVEQPFSCLIVQNSQAV